MKIIILFLSMTLIFVSCKEESIGQTSVDSVAPGVVTVKETKSIAGGAVIYYTLPSDEDLLYIVAEYKLSGESKFRDVKGSVYVDSLVIRGFGDTLSREVTLRAVDRSNNYSERVSCTITPDEPLIHFIGETLSLIPDFGGVTAKWSNPENAEIAVTIFKYSQNQEYVPIETFYSKVPIGVGSSRGMDTIPEKFAVSATDRWGNLSPMLEVELVPLFEKVVPKSQMKAIVLPTDAKGIDTYEWWKCIDGNTSGPDWGLYAAGGTDKMPRWNTLDLGAKIELSRIHLTHRGEYAENNIMFTYMGGSVKKMEIWGSNNPNLQTGDWDGWKLLTTFNSYKPSGLPMGENTAIDREYWRQGEDIVFTAGNGRFRYIRLKCLEVWGGRLLSEYYIHELDIWGGEPE